MTKSVVDLANQLTTCDKEPIHLIQSIQPHGYLLGFHTHDQKIVLTSANVTELFVDLTIESSRWRWTELFSRVEIEQIQNQIKIAERGQEDCYVHFEKWRHLDHGIEIHIFMVEGICIFEIEPAHATSTSQDILAHSQSSVDLGRSMLRSITLQHAGKALCRSIRLLTGFERVLLYQFMPTWEGVVIAEDKIAATASFMDHRFPATDIPLPARSLYLQNRTRLIPDAQVEPIPIKQMHHLSMGRPLDLSKSKLRAVSPIHLEYLKNMNVRSSFSVAVIVEDKLWGLIACHSEAVNLVPYSKRISCEGLSAIFAIFARTHGETEECGLRLRFESDLRLLFNSLKSENYVMPEIFRRSTEVLNLFSATGMAYVTPDHVQISGTTPTRDLIKRLREILFEKMIAEDKLVFACDELSALDPVFQNCVELAAGVLAIREQAHTQNLFLFFRAQSIQKIVWGGDPRKNLERRKYDGQINPRLSFESWMESVTGRSEPWRPFEIDGALSFKDLILDVLVFKQTLIHELGERLKSLT